MSDFRFSGRIVAALAAVAATLALVGSAPAEASTPTVVHIALTAHPRFVTATGGVAKPADVVAVTGRVSVASGRVVLQRRTGVTWKDVARSTVGSHGVFRLTAHALPVGANVLRVVRAASHHQKAVATGDFTVVVLRAHTPPVVPQPGPITDPVPAPPANRTYNGPNWIYGQRPYDDCRGAVSKGAGNRQADPKFVAEPVMTQTDETDELDPHATAASPLVDTGTTLVPGLSALPATDLAGNPRVADGNGDGKAVVDVGAYERQ